MSGVFVEVESLTKAFPITAGLMRRKVGEVRAVDEVSLSIRRGETLALVGESGSGKTTLARAILHVEPATSGRVVFDGTDLAALDAGQLRAIRRRLQMVFQDPYSSLNPRMRVGAIIAEPLVVHGLRSGRAAIDEVRRLLALVGLPPDAAERFPHEFSGGQRQRVGIARALAVTPDFIVADEPVSALDVSIQAQILSLLEELRERLKLTYLFIGHDLAVIRYIATRVAVMYLGRIVEIADRDDLFARPRHPYTISLLSAAPVPDPRIEATRQRLALKGEIPSPVARPAGCAFHPRCPLAVDRCRRERPDLSGDRHAVACWRSDEAPALLAAASPR
ncbi:MAG: ATP-binding cassette domain-containing protein [Alphaproteobacteria bacterium]|nr:ATP-binding cassette domain-containing protein [Alphaproteobacteria bacterium]